MRFGPTARMTPVLEHKEARLRAFITRHIESLKSAGVAPGTTVYRLIARSAESPPARVLQSLASELADVGIVVEAVFVQSDKSAAKTAFEFATCRHGKDLRLLDAHEQLVLDASTVWTGDCMRRDPSRRDTFEHFAELCPATGARANRAFAQLWRATGPSGTAAGNSWAGPRQPPLFDPSLIAGAEAPPNPATLRH